VSGFEGGRGRPVALLRGAALGGALAGGLEAAHAWRSGALAPGFGAVTGLLVLHALLWGALTAASIAPMIPLLRRARAGGRLGFLLGLGLVVALDVAERSLKAPAPFVAPPPLHSPPLFALVCLGGLALILGLYRLSLLARLGWMALPLGLVGAALAVHRPARALPEAGPLGAARTPVVLVTLDTTRDDHVGAERGTVRTPTVDALAAAGARFEQAFSQIPVTAPSHTTILSGRGPWLHGVLLNGHPIPEDHPLLAEILRGQGYRTAAFVSGYVLDGGLGFARGFEVYDDDFGRLPGWSRTLAGRVQDGLTRHLHPDQELERRASVTVDHALSWLTAQDLASSDQPFFLWVHLYDPHGPYHPPSPWDRAYYQGDPRDPSKRTMALAQNVAPYLLPSLRGITDVEWPKAQYSGEISYADQELGRLVAWLDAHHPEALIAVAGDHGESLGEHGVWFNHGDDLYEAATRVPLVLRMAGRIPAGLHPADPVELVDLAPTLAGLLGVPVSGMEGISLQPWLSGQPVDRPPHPFARSLTYDRAANRRARETGTLDAPRWRLVALRAPQGRYVLSEESGQGSWFDLSSDPGELHAGPPPEALAADLALVARSLLAPVGSEGPGLDDATRERLRALGYIDE